MDNQELVPIKAKTTQALEVANQIVIDNADRMTEAVEIGNNINKIGKQIKNRKEEITKPLNEALKSARYLFKSVEEDLAQAEKVIKGKMIDWNEMQRANEEVPVQTVKNQETGARATEKTIKEYVVVDKSLIPIDFMEPNMVAIKKSFSDGNPVAGIEERLKKIMSF
jgi:ABC-type transporter Mla subunit MlaD